MDNHPEIVVNELPASWPEDYGPRQRDILRTLGACGRERHDRRWLDAATRRTLDNFAVQYFLRLMHILGVEDSAYLDRLGALSAALATAAGMVDAFVSNIQLAAPLHDIGKIGVPDATLSKAGPLDQDERKIMRQHCETGYDLLYDESLPVMKMAAVIARHHHERWDGGGYPDGLAGDSIPLAARIVSICEAWLALVSERPHRPAWTREDALAHIREEGGKQFDPYLARHFARLPAVIGTL
ncbi:HD-GYP domain-containing protein [Pseudohaliea rubra]|uniref:Response regulator n=1 Tax=Pseudohaliea rubra DSM 19751 TaxID=1265313 RepID=A0A095XSN4_9GAMM|nr:HD domain-containing phosphohydrolase [Pseudohaliea rubra]KGE02671.1 Response regulator [Pseudohaliea rubra DSM 19751]